MSLSTILAVLFFRLRPPTTPPPPSPLRSANVSGEHLPAPQRPVSADLRRTGSRGRGWGRGDDVAKRVLSVHRQFGLPGGDAVCVFRANLTVKDRHHMSLRQ